LDRANGVARTDTVDFSASGGRHHCSAVWIRRINRSAEEEATRAEVLPCGLLLRVGGRRGPSRKAQRRWTFGRSRAQFRGIACPTGIVALVGAPCSHWPHAHQVQVGTIVGIVIPHVISRFQRGSRPSPGADVADVTAALPKRQCRHHLVSAPPYLALGALHPFYWIPRCARGDFVAKLFDTRQLGV
jgi:hypothetical protein